MKHHLKPSRTQQLLMTEQVQRAANLLKNAKKAIALTGAGVSTESGIPDFRSRGGLWSRFDPMEYGTAEAFKRNPAKVWKMLAELLSFADAVPNPGHLALAEIEAMGLLQGIITQNIDLLHRQAGSRNIVEFHGSIASFTCPACGRRYALSLVREQGMPPACASCASLLRPDVVFFDEQIPPPVLKRSRELLAGCDVLIVAGTSCQVAPASSFPSRVHEQGGRIIEINPAPELGGLAEVVLAGGFSAMMTNLLSSLAAA